MTCQSCVKAIRNALEPLVQQVQVDLEHACATIHDDDMPIETIIKTIEECGFNVPKTQTVTLSVLGMTCSSCVRSITNACEALEGVEDVRVSLEEKKATIKYDSLTTTPKEIINTIKDGGFDAAIYSKDNQQQQHTASTAIVLKNAAAGVAKTAQLHVGGMTCASCVNSIERGLGQVAGVSDVQVSLLAESATVQYDPAIVTPGQMVEFIHDIGFEAFLITDDVTQESSSESSTLQLQIYGMTSSL
ncbi:hypothetical protein G6F68_013254 [Rhizopus microsporus]|nr:hypothetical protein G6F68_013254 [Rhizopus microsporus]